MSITNEHPKFKRNKYTKRRGWEVSVVLKSVWLLELHPLGSEFTGVCKTVSWPPPFSISARTHTVWYSLATENEVMVRRGKHSMQGEIQFCTLQPAPTSREFLPLLFLHSDNQEWKSGYISKLRSGNKNNIDQFLKLTTKQKTSIIMCKEIESF